MKSSQHAMNNPDEPLAFPYLLEPMFWGTGEMLLWETGKLLESLDRERMYTDGCSTVFQSDTISKKEFEAIVDDIFATVGGSEREGPRGFYSFFPVLPEGTAISILDPSDFHTELLRLHFSAEKTVSGRPVAAYFRPDGDVISIATFTVGGELTDMFKEVQKASSVASVCAIIESSLYRELETRINGEMRRALGIDDAIGRSFSFQEDDTPRGCIPRDLNEILSIEERLGIVSEFECTHEKYPASVRFFIHHPVVE